MKFSGFVVACLAYLASFTLAEDEERVWVQYEEGQRSACLDTMTSFKTRSMPEVKIHHEFSSVGAFVVTATKDEIKELTLNKAVKMIAKDVKYHAMHIPESIQHRELQSNGETVPYGIDMVQATAAHERGFLGNGAKVCVLDTGIDSVHEGRFRKSVILIKCMHKGTIFSPIWKRLCRIESERRRRSPTRLESRRYRTWNSLFRNDRGC